ncbi:hypothetical protein, partial [Weissella soli]|uniref:hypothetical protein n=1 Tax=Weissella soli TaxID=155866 RepID=UPI00359F9569
ANLTLISITLREESLNPMKKNIVPILVISVLTSTVLLHTTPVNAATDAPVKIHDQKTTDAR